MRRVYKTNSSIAVASFCLSLAVVAFSLADESSAQPATKAKPQKAVAAENEAHGDEWVRLRRDGRKRPQALEVAIVRYVAPKYADEKPADAPAYVDLVGAIHVGDQGYYRELNRRFRGYDALLYELVAPKGTVVERGRGTSNAHPLGALQNGMKSMLELEHQLEKIDYTRPNFIHADLTPDEFFQSMEDKDESFVSLLFRMMGQGIAQQSQQAAEGESADVDIFAALLSTDRARKLKIALAKQFNSMEAMLSGMSGPEGSTLITERNKRALEVLREQLDAGTKKIGIFYGAGHLPDMHDRMISEFEMQPIGTVWLEAWDLRP